MSNYFPLSTEGAAEAQQWSHASQRQSEGSHAGECVSDRQPGTWSFLPFLITARVFTGWIFRWIYRDEQGSCLQQL